MQVQWSFCFDYTGSFIFLGISEFINSEKGGGGRGKMIKNNIV